MSVFVDITPEATASAAPVRTAQSPWRGRLTRAALLAAVCRRVPRRMATGRGIRHLEPDFRAVPEHGVAGLRRYLDHP